MSELPKNLFADTAVGPGDAAERATDAAAEQSAAASASTDGAATETADSGHTGRPANIMLYSDARAKAAREATEQSARQAAAARARIARRRLKRIAAIALIAGASGAVAGALATFGVSSAMQANAPTAATADADTLHAQLAKLETQLAALKVNADHLTKTSANQFATIGARVDKVEATAADAGATIARLAAAAPAAATVQPATTAAASLPTPRPLPADAAATLPPLHAAPETTASIAAPATNDIKPKGDLKSDYKAAERKPPVVDGWVLTSVGRRGGAIVANRSGFYEVYPGDPLPGIGRVEGIRQQHGRWVVVTPKGVIVRR
jgi:hypothetical protein